LIIDEPEMNLHPEAQVKLLEILTMAVNRGLKVLITTHSPYITDHLTNLMECYVVKDKIKDEDLKNYLFTGQKEAIISSDKVYHLAQSTRHEPCALYKCAFDFDWCGTGSDL
jgi:predicted ATPase